jgi:hypothetical protein
MSNNKRIFYVCSYGGSGSKMLMNSLRKYGNVEHVHSRNPPDKLEYIGRNGGGNSYIEWFNGIKIPDNELEKYTVIYIYRNPSFTIPSRFTNSQHLRHIQTDSNVTYNDVITTGIDLYNIREFHDNYTKPNKNRNYKIYCVKYEDIFEKQDIISKLLGIGKLNLINESKRKNSDEKLDIIYSDLIDEMNNNNFIFIS